LLISGCELKARVTLSIRNPKSKIRNDLMSDAPKPFPPSLTVPKPPTPLQLHVTSETANVSAVRRAVEAYSAAAGFDETEAGQIGLVINEAVANIIRHAYHGQSGRPIELTAESLPDGSHGMSMRLRLRDWGDGADPEKARKRDYIAGQPGGLGLVCLRGFMDEVEFAPQPDGGMLLTLVKRKSSGIEARRHEGTKKN
jgi:serine/threonine-protein kinase RsbW